MDMGTKGLSVSNLALLGLLVLTVGSICTPSRSVVAAWTKPKFCNDNDCPRYTVVKELRKDIQLRKYEPASWVSTDFCSIRMDNRMDDSFMTLFRYIDGANDAKTKIPMTSPVLTKVVPGGGPFCESNFTTSFYNPYKLQQAGAKIPKPTNPKVYIQRTPELQVYVMSFGGFAREAEYKNRAMALMEYLKANNLPFESKHWYTAGYNSPYELLGRHNEVWVVSKGAQAVSGR